MIKSFTDKETEKANTVFESMINTGFVSGFLIMIVMMLKLLIIIKEL